MHQLGRRPDAFEAPRRVGASKLPTIAVGAPVAEPALCVSTLAALSVRLDLVGVDVDPAAGLAVDRLEGRLEVALLGGHTHAAMSPELRSQA